MKLNKNNEYILLMSIFLNVGLCIDVGIFDITYKYTHIRAYWM